ENVKVSSATIAEVLKAGLDAEQAFVGNQNGNAKDALAGAAKKVEAVYAYPFQNHACMEPMNITVRYTPEKCEAWGPTQNGEGAFAAILAASGLPADKVDVYKTMLGGGFGRRGDQAAVVARGGHGAGPLSPRHAVQARGRTRCERQPHGAAHAHLGAID